MDTYGTQELSGSIIGERSERNQRRGVSACIYYRTTTTDLFRSPSPGAPAQCADGSYNVQRLEVNEPQCLILLQGVSAGSRKRPQVVHTVVQNQPLAEVVRKWLLCTRNQDIRTECLMPSYQRSKVTPGVRKYAMLVIPLHVRNDCSGALGSLESVNSTFTIGSIIITSGVKSGSDHTHK